jgi:hypothetical protein
MDGHFHIKYDAENITKNTAMKRYEQMKNIYDWLSYKSNSYIVYKNLIQEKTKFSSSLSRFKNQRITIGFQKVPASTPSIETNVGEEKVATSAPG